LGECPVGVPGADFGVCRRKDDDIVFVRIFRSNQSLTGRAFAYGYTRRRLSPTRRKRLAGSLATRQGVCRCSPRTASPRPGNRLSRRITSTSIDPNTVTPQAHLPLRGSNADDHAKQRLMPTVRDLIQTAVIAKTPAGQIRGHLKMGQF